MSPITGLVRPAQRVTLTDDVYESVKTMIMEHALAPGERVGIDGLARTLEVSPTPVREALARLESEGLVVKRPMSGYTTSPLLTRDQFEDLFQMRLLLEPEAAARAAGYAEAAQRKRVAAQAAEKLAVRGGDGYRRHAEFTALDERFHHLVAEISGSHLLQEAILRLHSHLHLHRLYFPMGTGNTVAEHKKVAQAIVRGDTGAAAEAMRAHLVAARTRHLAAFE
ncbi:MAG TPA: GntR family transcriptional regulator [Candidatus Limnocylindrales bacterium]